MEDEVVYHYLSELEYCLAVIGRVKRGASPDFDADQSRHQDILHQDILTLLLTPQSLPHSHQNIISPIPGKLQDSFMIRPCQLFGHYRVL